MRIANRNEVHPTLSSSVVGEKEVKIEARGLKYAGWSIDVEAGEACRQDGTRQS